MNFKYCTVVGFALVAFCQAVPWLKIEMVEPLVKDASWLKVSPDNLIALENLSKKLSKHFPLTVAFLQEIKGAWTKFKEDFSRDYKSVKEEGERFVIFAESFIRVKKHNLDKSATFKLGINQFSDKTEAEMKVLRGYGGKSTRTATKGSMFLSSAVKLDLPASVDWRTKGAVTPVKDQGQCGSCWAFSTTGSLEGQHFRKSGSLVSLSEQQLVDCSAKFGNAGCNGGYMDNAFKYIKENHGLDTEQSYPYKSGKTHKGGTCHFNKRTVGADDTGFVDIPTGDEEKLKEAVATKGPVSVAIDAGEPSFRSYQSGVYEEDECKKGPEDLDHGVLVVGYGEEEGIPYWLVKNSWNTTWGDEGYIKMRRNYNNMCGIATMASYPLV